MQPGKLKELHKCGNVEPFNKNLVVYPHMIHFDLMFFFRWLTPTELYNSPNVDLLWNRGDVCCF
jgi:hypothetical protein